LIRPDDPSLRTPFGLDAAVFAVVVEPARAVADRLEAGMVWINHPTSSEPGLTSTASWSGTICFGQISR
jgi:acyl-CoA reductase-like NAD-dependent aldehyde dehydrogenase